MDLILTAHKMRIYPNDEQIQIIETTFGAARNLLHALATIDLTIMTIRRGKKWRIKYSRTKEEFI